MFIVLELVQFKVTSFFDDCASRLDFKCFARKCHMMSYSSTLSLRSNAVKKSNICLHLVKCFCSHCCDIGNFCESRLKFLFAWWRYACLLASFSFDDVINRLLTCWPGRFATLGLVAEEGADWSNLFIHCDVMTALLNWRCNSTFGRMFNSIT